MVISVTTKITAIHFAVFRTIPAGICHSLNSTVDRDTAATIRQPETEETDLSFAALDGYITNFTPTSQESLLLRHAENKSWLCFKAAGPSSQQPRDQTRAFTRFNISGGLVLG